MNKNYILISLLFILALAFSLYLELNPVPKICLAGENCDYVRSTKYAELFGISLTKYAIVIFSIIISLSIYYAIKNKENLYLNSFVYICSGFALYFISLQIFVIKKICIYCLIIDSLVITSSLILLINKWKKYIKALKP